MLVTLRALALFLITFGIVTDDEAAPPSWVVVEEATTKRVVLKMRAGRDPSAARILLEMVQNELNTNDEAVFLQRHASGHRRAACTSRRSLDRE